VLDEYFTRTSVGARVAALLDKGPVSRSFTPRLPAGRYGVGRGGCAALSKAAPDFIVALAAGRRWTPPKSRGCCLELGPRGGDRRSASGCAARA
jgi:hypothetical protein